MLFLLRSLHVSVGNINAGCFILAALIHAQTSALEKGKRHTSKNLCVHAGWGVGGLKEDLHCPWRRLNEIDETENIPVVMQDLRHHYNQLSIIYFKVWNPQDVCCD